MGGSLGRDLFSIGGRTVTEQEKKRMRSYLGADAGDGREEASDDRCEGAALAWQPLLVVICGIIFFDGGGCSSVRDGLRR